MRILGGHDYFDSALAYGRDETLVFARRKHADAPILPYRNAGLGMLEAESLSFVRAGRDGSMEHAGKRYDFRPVTVWFAGKRYGGVRVQSCPMSFLSTRHDDVEWHWSEAKFHEFLSSIKAELAKPTPWMDRHRLSADTVREHFEKDGSRSEVDWLIENRVSVAVWQHCTASRGTRHWQDNTGWKIDVDGLGQMGFAKRLDPFAAFQELSMWIGGVLPRKENPTVEIRDEKVVLGKHGMDKWSFKTMPGSRP